MTAAEDGTPAGAEYVWADAVLLISLSGAIDADAQALLNAVLHTAMAGFSRAVVDLTGVTFFGAPGLNLIAGLTARGDTVQLVGIPRHLPILEMLAAVDLRPLVVVS
jgi:anti-anti-sigma factor